jgi:hypothetical protein
LPVAAEAELGGPEVEGGHCVGGEVECMELWSSGGRE